jgi:hypothetical protein
MGRELIAVGRSEVSMPLEYRIDRDRRVVFGTATRILSVEDVFSYQREVWSRSDLAGFDEVVDLSLVEDIVLPSSDRVRALAELAAAMEVPGASSRLAIVAPHDLAYGFARMFETYRTMDQVGAKVMSVFRSMQAALDWLGIEGPGGPPGEEPPGLSAGS